MPLSSLVQVNVLPLPVKLHNSYLRTSQYYEPRTKSPFFFLLMGIRSPARPWRVIHRPRPQHIRGGVCPSRSRRGKVRPGAFERSLGREVPVRGLRGGVRGVGGTLLDGRGWRGGTRRWFKGVVW